MRLTKAYGRTALPNYGEVKTREPRAKNSESEERERENLSL